MGQSPNRPAFDPFAPDPWNAPGPVYTDIPGDPIGPDPWNVPGPIPMRPLSDEERAELRLRALWPAGAEPELREIELEPDPTEDLIRALSDRVTELEAANKRLEDRLALVMDHGLAAGEKLAELQKAVLELRGRGTPDTPPAPAWAVIAELMEEISREFHDQAALRISTKRACNLYRSSGRSLEDFLQCMYAARHLTKSNASAIRLLAESEKGAVWTRKNAVPYFFAVLESTLQERRP